MVDEPMKAAKQQEGAKPENAPSMKDNLAAAAAAKAQQKISGLELVRFRNYFYRDGYRNSMTVLLMSMVINLVLLVGTIYLLVTKTPPVYFATQTDGSLIKIEPIDMPMVSQTTLINWATRAAVSAYTLNFVTWQNDLQNAQQYFTESGFNNFLDALKASGNLDTVVAKRLVVQATIQDVPRIVQQGILQGRYCWKIQIPMLVKYTSSSEELRQPVIVTLLIARVPTTQKADGIAIAQFVVQDNTQH